MTAPNPTSVALATERKPLDDEIDVFGLTHPGNVRKDNQDQFLICSLHKQIRLHGTSLPDPRQLVEDERLAFVAMVADGVGARAAGREASRSALEAVTRYVTQTMRCYYNGDPTREDEFLRALRAAALASHEAVLAQAQEHPEWAGMATTLTLVLGVWPRVYVLQVGDSRFYQLRHGALRQVTRDQTMAQELVDLGALRPDEASTSPMSHVLSSAIGGKQTAPAVTQIDVQWGDVALLCSDGLTRHVSDDEIRARLLALESSEQACRALLADALARGGTDNITIVVGRPRPLPGT